MAWFTTRVELHDATYADYQSLHAAMEALGFSRQITADDGASYHLPPAEYFYEGQSTMAPVLELAKRAADSTGKRFALVVAEAKSVMWAGLPRVQPTAPSRLLASLLR